MTELIFGVGVPTAAAPGDDPAGLALEAERLGYDFVSAADHPCGSNPSYETTTMLTWIAARTSRIKAPSRVLAVPFRPPAMLPNLPAPPAPDRRRIRRTRTRPRPDPRHPQPEHPHRPGCPATARCDHRLGQSGGEPATRPPRPRLHRIQLHDQRPRPDS